MENVGQDIILTKNGSPSGVIFLAHAEKVLIPNIFNYIQAGWNINFPTAVDFTASNGSPNLPNSLHYLDGGLTEYERAISSVGSILEKYKPDRQIPIFGFGAVPPS